MSSAVATTMTVEEFLALPENPGVERWLIDGELRELAKMAYRNQFHCEPMGMTGHRLNAWRIETRASGKVLVGDAGCRLPDGSATLLGLDIAYFSAATLAASPVNSTIIHGLPELAVEILSPSDTIENVNEKLSALLAAGTPLVWILDTYQRTVTAHRPGAEPKFYTASQTIDAEPILPGFRAQVAALFG